MFDIVVIGAGVVGSLLARELSTYKLNILVIEKENDVGNETSMANSAIVHSGYDPVPGTLKAKLNVLGNRMFPSLCKDLDVSFKQIGSLTVAINDNQLLLLNELKERSKINGVDVSILTSDEVKKLEPNIVDNVKGALFAKSAGIVNPFTLTVHAMENACDNGVILHLNEKVINIVKHDEFDEVITDKSKYEAKLIIDAAGLYSDEIHKLVEKIDYSITPRKGEYYVLDHYGENLVNHVIFPLPNEKGKGILIAPTTSGNFIIGPSSEPIEFKDDVSTDKNTLLNVKASAQTLIKNIPFKQVIRTFSGNRASSSTHDFIIKFADNDKHFIVLSGIESPGLASSIAIAKYVVENLVSKVLMLTNNEKAKLTIRKRIVMNELDIETRNKIIKENKSYGTIVCNCEKISLGEILDEFSRSVPPKTVKAIKKRVRAGFGKCQGGFCQSTIIKLIADYYKIDLNKVLFDKNGSEIIPFKR